MWQIINNFAHTHHVFLHQIIRILVDEDADSFYDALPASIDVILKIWNKEQSDILT